METTIFESIAEAVVEMEDDIVEDLCLKSLEMKIPAEETIQFGLIEGMNRVGTLYETQEYFLPEVLICSDTLNVGLDILKPHINKETAKSPLKIVIGVVEGDTHDIGKNLVRIMMESAGFEVYDLGRDVPLNRFIEKAEEVDAHIICMSTLMTTTMDGMKIVINELEKRNIRDKYMVMIGGGPISSKYAKTIGADIYSSDANEAVRKIKEWMTVKNLH